jgi:hypothetical protein
MFALSIALDIGWWSCHLKVVTLLVVSKDILALMKLESKAYNTLPDILNLIQEGQDLTNLPVQPLYSALRVAAPAQVAACLDKFSPRQRQIFLDLDLWEKDALDLESFEFWVASYSLLEKDELREEFVKGSEFHLFLKARFNVWTFDQEDPEYPEHDNYFLSDDYLLLFEYDESFEYASEVQALIKTLYSEWGLERAYTHLFKLTVDSFLVMQEDEYQDKRDRLLSSGFVDYYQALELFCTFPNLSWVEHFVRSRVPNTSTIDLFGKQQVLNSSAITPYVDHIDQIRSELERVIESKRKDYLYFNFIRFVNGSLSLESGMKQGPLQMASIGKEARGWMQLGFSYVEGQRAFEDDEGGMFGSFDFIDLYRIGKSLVQFELKKLRRVLAQHGYDLIESRAFLGRYLNEVIDDSCERPPLLSRRDSDSCVISSVDQYSDWLPLLELVTELIPYAAALEKEFKLLVDDGRVLDHYYLNYQISQIDFEAVMISSFANSLLKTAKADSKKMGLTLDEFKQFVGLLVDSSSGKLSSPSSLKVEVDSFAISFGMNKVKNISLYLLDILHDQLEGYDYSSLAEKDFQYVGGAIILNGGDS